MTGSTTDNQSATDQWRTEIGFLGSILGETIRDFAGQPAYELVEKIRRLSWQRRSGDADAGAELKQLFAELDETEIRVVVRAFTIFLDLLNLVEDRTRTQVLRERNEAAYPKARGESIWEAVDRLKQNGVSDADFQSLIDRINVELVFTAHPTEAKRRSVRRKLREIRVLLSQHESETMQHRRAKIENAIYRELALLWQTNFIRPWRPSVRQEVHRGLSITDVLWDVIPRINKDIDTACADSYSDSVVPATPAVTFGSWIGGDRDGHPGVTHHVTEETLVWLRHKAIEKHLKTCSELFDTFTVSNRQVNLGDTIRNKIDLALHDFTEIQEQVAEIPPGELIRRWLSVIRWRLTQALLSLDEANERAGAYRSAKELSGDVAILIDAVRCTPSSKRTLGPFLAWKSRIETFGFHLAKLDIRQNSTVYRQVINELMVAAGVSTDPAALDEAARCDLLNNHSVTLPARDSLSPDAQELLSLFSILHEHAETEGLDAMGAQIVSMTSTASDILSVGWLWNLTRPGQSAAGKAGDAEVPQLVPLLETIDDLKNGPEILSQLFSIPEYQTQLQRHGNRQMIMLGYSDSTKDGGYLSACWALNECQQELTKVAKEHGVALTFFHGRGGSLGRGGGPAARSILSLPRSTFDGRIRITEQGEVLAERYDDPEIAHRHLEQMVWSSLLAAGLPGERPDEQSVTTMQSLATKSRAEYRKLVEHPRFVEFFRTVTPLSEIEQLPIGSRPSRRKPGGGLSDLRAIPWVFSWTQCRCLLPAWFGLGTAVQELSSAGDSDVLQGMYKNWPFFRAAIDNAELALAKADHNVMHEYFQLAADDPGLTEVGTRITDELERSVQAILTITGNSELLANIQWLKESIRVRNRFIDPLNLMQVEMMRRWSGEQSDDPSDEHRHLMRLAINGVASGMRTSG